MTNGDEPVVFLRGEFIPLSQAALPLHDAGIVQGATVTEQTRTFGKQLFRLEDHLRRLTRSLRYARLEPGWSVDDWRSYSLQLVERNSRFLHPDDEMGIIQFVTAGEYGNYNTWPGQANRSGPTVCIHSFPLPFELWSERMEKGVHLVTPSIRHVPAQCFDPKIKCRSRMNYYLADQEARLVEPSAIALLLDLQGNITETNAANIFLVLDGELHTPPSTYTLPGISRAMVMELASPLGLRVRERDLQLYDAVNADEAMLSSTPFCLMPVAKINGISLPTPCPGPIYQRLLSAWSEAVGIDIAAQIQSNARRRCSRPST